MKTIGSEYKPTLDDIKELLKRIPKSYVPECLKSERYEPDRILWLDNLIYLKQKTGSSWDEIKESDDDKLVNMLFST